MWGKFLAFIFKRNFPHTFVGTFGIRKRRCAN